uniref:Uncharacterized protein n=1 Tax=Odontella aurita TaxID=265563 RepID=A0A7S4J2E5_9STRA|mmetsp:Transcript_36304/g.108905  ORF Transcript_36304/g.108905 Transcript_36304/m.108905 type:complete len:1572 (+) Transcript_36304:158-4873(+)
MLRGIHKLCEKGNWDEAIYDLRIDETARNAASIPGGWGEWTPLHLACKRNAPSELISELIKAAPIAAETFDLKDRLPIHYATEHGASIEILNALVQSCPESINGVDNSGHTPLHLGFLLSEDGKDHVRAFPSVDEVELLSDEEGTVAATADEAGNLPIHLAVNNIDRCSLDVLLTLICVDTVTLDKKNKDGLTPLHLALLNCAEKPISLDIVKALIGAAEDGEEQEAEIEVLKIADNNGRLPLHLACLNFEHIPLDVLKELLRGFGGAVLVPMSDGSLPLDILEGLRHTVTKPQDVLDFNEKSDLIFAHHPNIEQYRNEPSRLGRISNRIKTELFTNKCLSDESRMIWTWMCMLSEEEDKDKMHFITISQTLNSIRDDSLKRSLASIETVTAEGSSLPLNACVSDRVAILLKRCLLFADRFELLTCDVEKSDTWCKVNALDWENSDNQRRVIIKFMKTRDEFVHETKLRSKLASGAFPAVVPMMENFDVGRLGTDSEKPGDAKYEYDISKGENPGGVDLSQYPCAVVLHETGERFSTILKDTIASASSESTLRCAKDIANVVRRLHSSGLSHGGIDKESFVQLGPQRLVFESLRSASPMQGVDTSRECHIGEVSRIRTGFLPPEMFVKLSNDELKSYMKYWKSISGDADIKNILKSEDTRTNVAARVDSFLGANQSCFSDLWSRISSNADLWEKIRPRKVGDSYFAIRAFYSFDPSNGKPFHPEKLPYELLKTDAREDTWTLGLLLYQIMTGEVMFRINRSGDIENDASFAALCNWNVDGDTEREKLAKVHNPVARDLIRVLLSNPGHSSDMDDVCDHAFLSSDSDEEEARQQCLKILKHERNVRLQREAMAERDDLLQRRTKELACIPTDTERRLEHSTWTQWDEPKVDATVPTTFVLLPYELQSDGKTNEHTVAEDDKEKALLYGNAIAHFMHYATFSGNIAKRYGTEITKDCCSTKLWEYSELNKSTLSATENNLLAICRGILTRIDNAEQVLSDIIKTVLPDAEHALEAKKLVSDAVEGIIDVGICQDVTRKAAVVESAVQSLFNVANDGSSQMISTEQIVSEQLQKLTGKDTSLEEDTKKKTDVEMTLFRLVKDFSEDPLEASRSLLLRKIEDVLDIFSSDGARLYLVDDMTGSPVSSLLWPIKVSLSPDTLRILLPGMYLSFKSFCKASMTDGLSLVLGLPPDELPQDWISDTKWNIGGFDPISTEHELISLQAATIGRGMRKEKFGQLESLRAFFLTKDPHETFSGLARVLCPNNRVLWTLRADYKEERSLSLKQVSPSGNTSRKRTTTSKINARVTNGSSVKSALKMEPAMEKSKIAPSGAAADTASEGLSSSGGTVSQTAFEAKIEDPVEMLQQVKPEQNEEVVDEEQSDEDCNGNNKTDDDDITVATMTSMVSNPVVAFHSLPPTRDEGKVTNKLAIDGATPGLSRETKTSSERVHSIHDDVTPRASTNRTLSSSSSVLQQKKTPTRGHRRPPSDSPLRGRSLSRNGENNRNRANSMTRTSPGLGLYKKAMAKGNGSTPPVGSSPFSRNIVFSEDSDDTSVISMVSTASKRNLRRFRTKRT